MAQNDLPALVDRVAQLINLKDLGAAKRLLLQVPSNMLYTVAHLMREVPRS